MAKLQIMARSDNEGDNKVVPPRTTSFAGKHRELAGDIPDAFREAPPHRREFDHARDPYISKQLKAMEKTEAQRRGESEKSGRDSEMVKLDKPFPELRPKHEQAPIRQAFNQVWLREQREARMADLEHRREEQRVILEQAAEQSRVAIEREAQEQQQHGPQR